MEGWKRWFLIFFIIWMGLLVGCAIWQSRQGVSTRPTEGEIIFSHKRHVQMDIECAYCHTNTPQSGFASDNKLPAEKDCMRCHKRTQGCELCHRDVKNASSFTLAPYRVKFSHKFHLQLQRNPKIVCTTCHLMIAESTHGNNSDQPRMKVCRECHDVTKVDCTTCHDNLSVDVTLLPVSHDSSWLNRHRLQASQNDELCAECHRGKIRPMANILKPIAPDHSRVAQARSCADCHRGDIWPEEVHENNYIQTHRIDAAANSNTCRTCHERQECRQCHEDRGFRYEMVHPAGFIFQHASEAKRRLTNCVTCHEEEDCLGCHSTISPHPPGWDRDITSNNEQLCLKCHIKGEF